MGTKIQKKSLTPNSSALFFHFQTILSVFQTILEGFQTRLEGFQASFLPFLFSFIYTTSASSLQGKAAEPSA
jgi:hypothetical protein